MNITIPEGWKDVTAEQVRAISHIDDMALTREEKLMSFFCCLSGCRISFDGGEYILHNGSEKAIVGADMFRALCEKVEWVINEKPCDIACPFSWDRHLNNTSFEAYFFADSKMLRYTATGESKYAMDAMRDLGETNITENDVPVMRIWWSAFKEWLKQRYPDVFASGDSGSAEPYNPSKAWQDFMLMLNDGRPQDNGRIGASRLHDVLSAVQYRIEQAKEREKSLRR